MKHIIGRTATPCLIGLAFLFGAGSAVAATAATTRTAPAAPATTKLATKQAALLELAPADEYFGPLKESIIGIRNTIRDLGLRYDFNHDIPVQTVASARLTERAIRDWETKYPHDPQLPRAVFLLQRLYTKVLTWDSRNRAHLTALWLFADFSKSPQAKQLHKVLTVEHLAALPSPPPTPASAPTYQSVFGSGYPSEFNGNAPSSSAPANPSSGTPAPVPNPG